MTHPIAPRVLPGFAIVVAILTVCGPATMPPFRAACRADQPGDKTYSIKLTAPSHVGDKYDYSASKSREIRNEIASGQEKPTLDVHITALQLEGTLEVLAVDSKGGVTKLAFTIRKFVRTDTKGPEILPPGAVVIADATAVPVAPDGEKTQYSLKDGALTEEQSAALAIALDKAHPPDTLTDDEIYGTEKPQKIGGSWPINTVRMVADFGKSGLTIRPEDITGETTLVGTEKFAGMDCLKMKTHITANNVTAPFSDGMKVTKGSKIEAEMSGSFQVGGSALRPTDVTDNSMDLRAAGTSPDGGAMSLHLTMKAHSETHSTPQKR